MELDNATILGDIKQIPSSVKIKEMVGFLKSNWPVIFRHLDPNEGKDASFTKCYDLITNDHSEIKYKIPIGMLEVLEKCADAYKKYNTVNTREIRKKFLKPMPVAGKEKKQDIKEFRLEKLNKLKKEFEIAGYNCRVLNIKGISPRLEIHVNSQFYIIGFKTNGEAYWRVQGNPKNYKFRSVNHFINFYLSGLAFEKSKIKLRKQDLEQKRDFENENKVIFEEKENPVVSGALFRRGSELYMVVKYKDPEEGPVWMLVNLRTGEVEKRPEKNAADLVFGYTLLAINATIKIEK